MNRLFTAILLVLIIAVPVRAYTQTISSGQVTIKKTPDFRADGLGNHANWSRTNWIQLPIQTSAGRALHTSVKLLYSNTGLYFLFRCEDQKLTATIQKDFGALYNEDVIEVFLWPDPTVPVYFEYELSPLNYELPILVPNINGRFQGWKPWRSQNTPQTQRATSVQGGKKEPGAAIMGWTAEFFIPYALMKPLVTAIPVSGTTWRGNLYRIDYDQGYQTWAWQKTGGSFHEFEKFGVFFFE